MAVVWAKSNGNWSDTTLWAFWNENTRQIEDYGQVPQKGDIIYMDGRTVTYPDSSNWGGTLSLEESLISNGDNTYTGNRGGVLLFRWHSGTGTIYCNFECHQGKLLDINNHNQPTTINIVGNIYVDAGVFTGRSSVRNYYFTGNILMKSGYLIDAGNSPNITINGNALSTEASTALISSVSTRLIVNGILGIGITTATSAIINGNIAMPLNREVVTSDDLNINGSITYKSTNNKIGVRCPSLIVLNPDTFTWKDVTEPRSNPFIILTNADMNNLQQYPPENRVVAGTPYAYDEKVGTFTVDYPQEAEVLKDVVYDSGNKTGKLVVLPAELISRLLNCPTIETMQQLLIAHLNPETD